MSEKRPQNVSATKSRLIHTAYGAGSFSTSGVLFKLNYDYVKNKKDAGADFDPHDADLESWLSPAMMSFTLLFFAIGFGLIKHATSPSEHRE